MFYKVLLWYAMVCVYILYIPMCFADIHAIIEHYTFTILYITGHVYIYIQLINITLYLYVQHIVL